MEAEKSETRTVGRITEASSSPHSSWFRTSFVEGEVYVDVTVDQISDANIMSKCFLEKVQE